MSSPRSDRCWLVAFVAGSFLLACGWGTSVAAADPFLVDEIPVVGGIRPSLPDAAAGVASREAVGVFAAPRGSDPPSWPASPTIGRVVTRPTFIRPAHDLRQPRPPRHRSERPTTGLASLEDVLAEQLLEFLRDAGGQRFRDTAAHDVPRAGHPRRLLRPPSRAS